MPKLDERQADLASHHIEGYAPAHEAWLLRVTPRCGAKNRKGGTCSLTAGHGTEHLGIGRCKFHGGAAPQAQAAGKRELQRRAAAAAVVTYGLSREVDPHTALLEELYRTAGAVAYLASIVRLLEQHELKQKAPAKGGVFLEAPAVWLQLYAEERDRLTRVAKTCVDVGIEERRVKLAEEQGALLVQVIRGVLTELGVIDRPEVPDVVRRHLTLVAPAA